MATRHLAASVVLLSLLVLVLWLSNSADSPLPAAYCRADAVREPLRTCAAILDEVNSLGIDQAHASRAYQPRESKGATLAVAYLLLAERSRGGVGGGTDSCVGGGCQGKSLIAEVVAAIQNLGDKATFLQHTNETLDVHVFLSPSAHLGSLRRALPTLPRLRVQAHALHADSWRPRNLYPNDACCEASTLHYTDGYAGMNYWRIRGMWEHPVLRSYDYLWTLDADVRFVGPIGESPAAQMQRGGGVVGYTSLVLEPVLTVPDTEVVHWAACLAHPRLMALQRMDRRAFNGNFIVLKADFFRSDSYRALSQHLTSLPGNPIFRRRWSDQNVYWLAASLFLTPEMLFHIEHRGIALHKGGPIDALSVSESKRWGGAVDSCATDFERHTTHGASLPLAFMPPHGIPVDSFIG